MSRPKIFGRDDLIDECVRKISKSSILLVYGMRGNGKTSLIEEVANCDYLSAKKQIRIKALPTLTAQYLYWQIRDILGDHSESPITPNGTVTEIRKDICHRFQAPIPSWIWIEDAHYLFDRDKFRDAELKNLVLALQEALGNNCSWLFELRERPPKDLFTIPAEFCEVPGLNKEGLSEYIYSAAPPKHKNDWLYCDQELDRVYRWLGGRHEQQAHPQAATLLIHIAKDMGSTPLEVMNRYPESFEQNVEEVLLDDLYTNVLSSSEQGLLQALALYNVAIPHDHIDSLETNLNFVGAWNGLNRRCLLAADSYGFQYHIHSFISSWIRIKHLGYDRQGDDSGTDLPVNMSEEKLQHTMKLHAAIADCWQQQLGTSKRLSELNITRALEMFRHLVSAGDIERIGNVPDEFLGENREWAAKRLENYNKHILGRKCSTEELRKVLELRAVFEPENAAIQRFIGQCFQKEEGDASENALLHLTNSCDLSPGHPNNWADLGKTLLARGAEGAATFLDKTEEVAKYYPNAISDVVRAIQCKCLEIIGREKDASNIRTHQIQKKTRHPAFYSDEVKTKLYEGELEQAQKILELAEQNYCFDETMQWQRAKILKQLAPEESRIICQEQIKLGSKYFGYYALEANTKMLDKDYDGGINILNMAESNGIGNNETIQLRFEILRKKDPIIAREFCNEQINTGISNVIFYEYEAKCRKSEKDYGGALNIIDLGPVNTN